MRFRPSPDNSPIPMVAALNVNRATNCDRPLAPPTGKTRINVNKIYCAFEPIYIINLFFVSQPNGFDETYPTLA